MPELLYAAIVVPAFLFPAAAVARVAAPWVRRMHYALDWPERIGIALLLLMGAARMCLAAVAGV